MGGLYSELALLVARLQLAQFKSRFVLVVLMALWAMHSQNARAEQGDVFRPYINLTQSYDSNLRRFDTKENALLFTGSKNTSDWITTSGVGLIVDKPISQQRLYADISVNKTKFDRNSELDNDGNEATLRWDWKVGTHLEGKLESYHQESLVPFSDFRGIAQNLLAKDTKTFDAVWRFHPSWQLHAMLQNFQLDYSQQSQKNANLDETAEELGIDYVPSTSSMIGILYRHARGDRPVLQQLGPLLIDNSYNQDELKMKIDWVYSVKTRLQFLGGYVERKHDEISERDSSGINARLNFMWAPTGKTSLNTSFWREISSSSYVTNSYTLNKGISVNASWYTTSKITVRAGATYYLQDFEGDVIFNSQREDKNKNISLGFVYVPMTSLLVNTSLNHSERESSSPFLNYRSNGMSITAQYEF